MVYRHRFTVKAPLAMVVEFHRRSANLPAISPVPVRLAPGPEILAAGDEQSFTLWLGPLPVRWTAHIEESSETGFTDRQVSGPFARWVHRHGFVEVEGGVTSVHDEIDFALSRRPLEFLVGVGMAMGLPFLFLYRGWRTKRLLE